MQGSEQEFYRGGMGVVSSLSFNICNVEGLCSVASSERTDVVGAGGGVGAILICVLSHTNTQASRSPHLIILVLTREKGFWFAADLFECANTYFGENLVKPLKASVSALGSCAAQRALLYLLSFFKDLLIILERQIERERESAHAHTGVRGRGRAHLQHTPC